MSDEQIPDDIFNPSNSLLGSIENTVNFVYVKILK